MAKLWTDHQEPGHELVDRYNFAKDVVLDRQLVRYDILGSLAHAKMLEKIRILSKTEGQSLKKKLLQLLKDYQAGKWQIAVDDEDVHTAVEGRLAKVGRKLHTARSRNDQVLLDLRLYGIDHLLDSALAGIDLAETLLRQAKKHEFLPMPGYTHLQRAMPCSWGMWMGSHASGLVDALSLYEGAFHLLDQCPLGSGAGFGTSLNIDRDYTAKALGFSRVQVNSLYCQNSRGLIESALAGVFSHTAGVCGRLAADLCLFASSEFGFIDLPDAFFTGSSIMPQKRNPDLFELVRSRASILASKQSEIRHSVHGLSSGYSKDTQEIKEPYLESCRMHLETLQVMNLALKDLQPVKDKLMESMAPELFATDVVYEKYVKKGVPFRDAYLKHKKEGNPADLDIDPVQNLKQKNHLGAPGRLELQGEFNRLKTLKPVWKKRRTHFNRQWNKLLEG